MRRGGEASRENCGMIEIVNSEEEAWFFIRPFFLSRWSKNVRLDIFDKNREILNVYTLDKHRWILSGQFWIFLEWMENDTIVSW